MRTTTISAVLFGLVIVSASAAPIVTSMDSKVADHTENRMVPQVRVADNTENRMVPQFRVADNTENRMVPQIYHA